MIYPVEEQAGDAIGLDWRATRFSGVFLPRRCALCLPQWRKALQAEPIAAGTK